MENEIKTYRTASDKIQSRAFQVFGPWLCIAESKTRLRDQDDNWLNEWQVTEEWQYNAEGWSEDIYPSGMKEEKSPLEKRFCQMKEGQKTQMLCLNETAEWSVGSQVPNRQKQSMPIYDYPRGVKWRQFINEYDTHMTEVACLKSGWSVKSNQYPFGSLTDDDLDKLVTYLMKIAPK